MRKISGQTWFLAVVVAGSCLLVGYLVLFYGPENGSQAAGPTSRLKLEDIPFDGQRAYDYLKKICQLGPRPSGSKAMDAQRQYLTTHFERLGAKVTRQEFRANHPLDGSAVDMVNLIVQWHPDRKERILLGAHYDTRPYPDRDPTRPRGTFVGASDGASGVALLMELGRKMPDLAGKYGVDFVLFDGEELVFSERGDYCLGSKLFAERYVAEPPPYRYRQGVVLDMIGDADLQLYEEVNSMQWPETRAIVEAIWSTAKKLGVREFIPRPRHAVSDDHLPLCTIAKIPVCDVIDFDYTHWHTEGDTADKCSALSLAKVGWVMHEWLKTAVVPPVVR